MKLNTIYFKPVLIITDNILLQRELNGKIIKNFKSGNTIYDQNSNASINKTYYRTIAVITGPTFRCFQHHSAIAEQIRAQASLFFQTIKKTIYENSSSFQYRIFNADLSNAS